MATAPAPLKIPGDTNGLSPFILKTSHRKKCSAAWRPKQKSNEAKSTTMTNKSAYQPDGYQSVIPYLHVNAASKLIAFMKEVFDTQEIAVYPRPDGTVGH